MPARETELQHRGDDRSRHYGAVSTPVYRASLFGFEEYAEFLDAYTGKSDAHLYTRHSNPTRRALETKIAYLEQAEHAIAFSSGMGAISAALLSFLGAGDHALVVSCCYGPTRQFCNRLLQQMGVEIEFFHAGESADLRPRLKPNTRLIYLESPGSLTFQIQDIRAVTALAREHNITTVLDNSWATPLYQQPIPMGVDVVVHSATKYIAGHSDVVVGILACNAEAYQRIRPVAALLGANLSPDDAYLVTRGLRTLPVRLSQLEKNGLEVARWLESRPEVREVLHPGLPSFPGYELARSQMQGSSSLFGFKLHPAGREARHAFVNALQYFTIAVSWGGFESLILPLEHAFKSDPETRRALGLDDDTYRICIGLENPADLIADLERGLAARNARL